MNSRSGFVRELLILALTVAILLTAMPQQSAQAGPADLLDEIYRAINQQSQVVNWKAQLDPTFRVWVNGGSENLTVIAAVVGLFREPFAFMPNSTVTYVDWLTKFLGSQTGQVPADPPRLRYFKNAELFSNTYDAPVVTAILAVRYWARKNNHATLTDYARRYLRASWAIYGLAAGSGPVRDHGVEGYTPPFFVDITLKPDGTYGYDGPFIALGGARSFFSHRLADDKQPLFGRASAWPVNKTNEDPSEKNLINSLLQKWGLLTPPQSENLYGVTPQEQANLRSLAKDGDNSAGYLQTLLQGFLPWISDIRTRLTYRIVAWPGVRASLMEYNPNGITPNIYGIAYYDGITYYAGNPSNRPTAYFLYPWTEANGGGLPPGWTRMDSNRWWASNDPGKYVIDSNGQIRWTHPVKEVSIPIPSSAPSYHVVLSQNAPPYKEQTLPTHFPPPDPPEIDFPRNP